MSAVAKIEPEEKRTMIRHHFKAFIFSNLLYCVRRLGWFQPAVEDQNTDRECWWLPLRLTGSLNNREDGLRYPAKRRARVFPLSTSKSNG
jgi:hypothetical protein